MLVEVGTYVDLTYLNEPNKQKETMARQVDSSHKLYSVGTTILFIKNLSLPPQSIRLAL